MKIVLHGWGLSRIHPLDNIIDNDPVKAGRFKLERFITYKQNFYGKEAEDTVTYNLEVLMFDDLDILGLRSIQLRNVTKDNARGYYDHSGRYTQS